MRRADRIFADIKFPGILKQCETCHLPGTYDFSAPASAGALPNAVPDRGDRNLQQYGGHADQRLARSRPPTTAWPPTWSVYSLSPYIVGADDLTNYGGGFSFDAVSPCRRAGSPATTLVTSPLTTVCFACHKFGAGEGAHIQTNGGLDLNAARSTALATTETCMICHDTGRIADIKVMHSK